MSAALRATTALAGLTVLGFGAAYTLKTPNMDFTNSALASAEHAVPDAITAAVKPRLPSNYFQFSIGSYKISNARA